MRGSSLLVWLLGGFAAYELAAYLINRQRIAASGAAAPSLLPFDFIGQITGTNPSSTLVPAGVAAGLANPAAARNAAFTASTYPGVAPLPAISIDPNNLLNLSGYRK